LVVQIRHLIIGLETTITQEAGLRKELQAEVDERIKRNEQLAESESHYRSLFYHNPSPMWIFDADTLAFLQVNGTAIRKYGYTRAEFANMTIKDIRGVDEVGNLLEILKTTLHANNITNSTVQHARKNGEKFYAEVRCSNIKYQGKNARLVIARDITAQMHHTQAIEKQNLKLQEIAFMQSHLVRAPLCRIMGLVDIMSQNVHDKTDPEILDYLQISVHELDDIIKTIVNNTEGTIVYDGV
jgi:PAS domain S-box-containing protein